MWVMADGDVQTGGSPMKIAYYGSCPSEEFVKYAFPENTPAFFCYGINVASFMDEPQTEIAGIEEWPESVRKKLQFEARKGFCRRLKAAAPDTLVIDFTRASRASLMRYGDSLLTVPYELLEASPALQLEAFARFDIITFGSQQFWTLVIDGLQKFCDFVAAELPGTDVILLDVPPAVEYRGSLTDSNSYMADFCRWQMRYPICRLLVDFCLGRIERSRVLSPPVTPFSDDDAAYGPGPMHYATKIWQEIAASFHAGGGFQGLPRSGDPAMVLTSYSGLMNAFAQVSGGVPDLRRFGLDILHGALPYLFAKIRHPAPDYFAEPIDAQDAVSAFRWILGREPESALTFLNHYGLANRKQLRETLLCSAEFQNQVNHHART